jgi:hypothetical protein
MARDAVHPGGGLVDRSTRILKGAQVPSYTAIRQRMQTHTRPGVLRQSRTGSLMPDLPQELKVPLLAGKRPPKVVFSGQMLSAFQPFRTGCPMGRCGEDKDVGSFESVRGSGPR